MGAPWSAEFTPAKAGVALQTAPLNVCKYTPRGSVIAYTLSKIFRLELK